MSDDSNTVNSGMKFALPQIRVVHPKTKVLLAEATPAPGNVFDLKLPQDISPDEMLIVISDLVEFHYKHCMGVQKRLLDTGMSIQQVGDLFFPGVPSHGEVDA